MLVAVTPLLEFVAAVRYRLNRLGQLQLGPLSRYNLRRFAGGDEARADDAGKGSLASRTASS